MVNWFKYPFIRLLMPLATGIFLSYTFEMKNVATFVQCCALSSIIMTAVLVVLSVYVRKYSLRWVFGLLLNLHLILIGMFIVHIRDDDLDDIHLTFCNVESHDVFVARVFECPTIKEKSVKVVLELDGIKHPNGDVTDVSGKTMAYFEKSPRAENIRYGDVLVFFDPPDEVERPKNPEQFDYAKYLHRKGISHQVYLKEDRWMSLNVNLSNPIFDMSYKLRDLLLETMQRLGITGDEYAVAAAILIGFDDTLPQELRESYVAAGSMHILCVSGLHVGIVFLVFSYMLAFLDERKRWQHILRQSLLLILIWMYAFLAGLAPSILRATIMLSFVIIGNMLNRKGVLMNSLAASAFLLLCLNPANLLDVGFLLSYVAVIGIVMLQKPIYHRFYITFKPLDKIWEITSVTLAAQMATVPFSIFYFHQFPLYFWLSNLFMTPVSTAVIIGGMLMLILSPIPYINIAVAWCVKWLIFAMNYVVTEIENLPMSIIKGLYINNLEFICLVIILLFLIMLIEYKNKTMVYVILSMSLIFSLSQLYRAVVQRNQQFLAVYSLTKGTAIDFVCGNEHVVLCDTVVFNNESITNFNMENHQIKEGVYKNGMNVLFDTNTFENKFLKKKENMLSFAGKLIGFSAKNACSGVISKNKPHFDCFIIFGKDNMDVDLLFDCYVIDILIIDASVPDYLKQKIIEKSEKIGQEYYDIKTQGAFCLK